MIKLLQVLAISFLLFFSACKNVNCDRLPQHYSSYQDAIEKIQNAHFKIEESVNTSKSSWVRGASFYSCDGISGYFILQTDEEDYVYANVPTEIWTGFKNADSFGTYYNQKIKHKYSFNLNQ